MKKRNFLQNNLFILQMIAKICPWRIPATFLNSFTGFFSQIFFSIIFLSYIVDALEHNKSFWETAVFVLLFMGIFLLINLYSAWYDNKYLPVSNQELSNKINKTLFEKVSDVDISCFETPDFFDKYTAAIKEANSRAVSILDNLANVISAILTAAFLVFKMLSLDFVAPFFIIIPIAGTLIINKYYNKVDYQHYMDDIPHWRRLEFVNRAIFFKKYAKEIRLSNIKNVLYSDYDNATCNLLKNVDKYKHKKFWLNITKTVVCYPLVMHSAWVYVAFRVMVSKTLNAGDYIILANAIVNSTTMVLDLIGNINQSMSNSLYINNLRTFLEYEPKIKETQEGIVPCGDRCEIEFKNVSFKYEGQSEYALKNICLIIKPYEKAALVGHNGAGKTTIVKLIMRLYDATEGEIFMNGINIKEYDIKEYRKLFGTVFQDYQIFAMSVNENVLLHKFNESDKVICENALKVSGAYEKVETLHNKAETMLLREYDDGGVILSGGEFQKIAVSRVFAKDNRIMILDEPSTALDPIAEYKMYETLSQSYSGDNRKTVILISHRLSSAVNANKVVMLENGEIIEEGTHEELMQQNGRYHDLFEHQAKNYV